MTPITLASAIGVWSIICLIFYRRTRSAPWLAGSSVATCLFFLGASVAVSPMVEGALASLTSLWVSVLILCSVHVACALRRGSSTESASRSIGNDGGTTHDWDQLLG